MNSGGGLGAASSVRYWEIMERKVAVVEMMVREEVALHGLPQCSCLFVKVFEGEGLGTICGCCIVTVVDRRMHQCVSAYLCIHLLMLLLATQQLSPGEAAGAHKNCSCCCLLATTGHYLHYFSVFVICIYLGVQYGECRTAAYLC